MLIDLKSFGGSPLNTTSPLNLHPHDVILFQGNSITDAGKTRLQSEPSAAPALGAGYAGMIAAALAGKTPAPHLQIYNRAVSGDQLIDLIHRWERDTFPLLPDVLSILIGVNDLLQELSSRGRMDLGRYEEQYQKLLSKTAKRLPYTRLVLCQPFLLPVSSISSTWLEEAARLGDTIAALAEEFYAVLVPFQEALNEAAADQSPSNLLFDGLHPTAAGHALLADCWLEHVVGDWS